ncbi:MAG: ester cyclase [Janthinobacterium lividum]
MSERKARLQSFLDRVWSGGEIDACDDYLGASYTIEHDPGDPWEGRTLDLAGFKDRVRQSRAPFPDQRFAVQAMLADDAGVAVSWTWSATHHGDIPGFPATGAPLAMSGMTLYRFDAADRITGHWQVSDRLAIFQQLAAARKS